MPSARSRSVVGQKLTLVPAAPYQAMSAAVRWVACTAVCSGPPKPCSASSAVGVLP